MSVPINIDRPIEITPQRSRRDAASEQIKHYIQSNQLRPKERLPTVRKMSEHFEVSRDAVWRALRQLHEEEWLDLLPNKRYTVSDKVYKHILSSLRVKAIFSGKRYIYFSGFRRLADSLSKQCRYNNIDLEIDLLPLQKAPDESIWENCDLLMIDSDCSGTLLKTFADFPVPVIGLDANYSERYRANVVTDHHLGGRLAAEAMLKRDARNARVIYHAGSENNPRVSARIEGFRHTWLEGGRPADSIQLGPIEWCRSSFELALNVKEFLENNPSHDSFFVTDGRLATNFLEVLVYMGVSVPEEARLIGYDGAQRGALTDPPMTTIQQDMDRIAQSAVSWIRKIASGEEESEVLERISPLLVKRDSI